MEYDAARYRLVNPRNAIALAAAALALAVTAFAPQVLNDGDTYLHIAAGQRMLADGAILFADPFSYTRAGAPWDAHEWLSEILMAAVYRAGGWSGLVLLFAGAAAAAVFVLSRALGRRLDPAAQIAVTVLAMACMSGSLLVRPHLLALSLLALWTAMLVKARDEDRAPPMALAALMVIWVNIHASFLLGFAIAGGLALEAVLARRASGRGWVVFLAAAFGAALINPHFVDGLLFPLRLMAVPALAHVGEWQATPFSILQPVVPVTAAALYVIVTRRVRIPLVRAAMLIVLAYLAFTHVRHQMVFAIVAPLLLAAPLGAALGAAPQSSPRWRTVSAAALCAGAILIAVRLVLPIARGDAPVAPISALAHVPQSLRGAPVLNDYAFGGYLIFAGVKPFIDSRAELYGEAGLERYAALIRPGPLTDAMRRYDIRWSILAPSSPIARELAREGWKQIYADRFAVVQIRDNAQQR